MKYLFMLSLLTNIRQSYPVAPLDGSLLSDELKKIKEDIGVNHIQEKFNTFPYETKTDTGSQLLYNIQYSLNSSLVDLNEVLKNVKDKIQQANNSNSGDTNLPYCCTLIDDQLSYVPEFQTKVNLSTACYTKSPFPERDLTFPPDIITDTMKTNYENNTNVLWQHYSTTKGISFIYPATKFQSCINFDPRFTSSHVSAASATNKDVVIVFDTSSSMKQQSAVLDRTKIGIAREAVINVVKTLKEDDRVGIVNFDKNTGTPTGQQYHHCYELKLAFATKVNVDKMEKFVSSISASSLKSTESNFEHALRAAFRFFNSSDDSLDISNREQVILFLSDGKSTGNEDPRKVIRDENQKYENRIRIFTYLIGEDQEAMAQLKEMAKQNLSNATYGQIKIGIFKSFSQDELQYMPTVMAQFYVDLPHDQKKTSIFSVPYVDHFSRVGLITSLCLPVNINLTLHGVICTDVKISELLAEVEYFTEEEYSYAFIIDGTGRVIMHPLLPNAQFVKAEEEPVLVDIGVLEREPAAHSMIESMKIGNNGTKDYKKFFARSRGRLVNDGSSNVFLHANLFWGPVPHSNFSLCIVLVDDSYSEINESEFRINSSTLNNVFMYNNRCFANDNHRDCKFYSRHVTFERSSVKLTQAAFKNPFQYLDRDETADDVARYTNYMTRNSSINPGFRTTLRSAVWASYTAEQFWRTHKVTYVSQRYFGSKAGLIRIYPSVTLEKSYDHQKRTWWREALAHPNKMTITSPYYDATGAGIVISIVHTVYKKDSKQVTAVVGADFALEYFNWCISKLYPQCDQDYGCIIIDDSGFIVMHPKMNEIKDESRFQGPKHLTLEEHGIAEEMVNERALNFNECQDFSENKDLRSYRVTLPQKGGLETENIELRTIDETNLFIIRVKNRPANKSSCDPLKSPDSLICRDPPSYCLCHRPIQFDVCANKYNTKDASLPCSSRLPDTSANNEPDILDGLSACFDSACHRKQNKSDCLSEGECSWCEFTDTKEQIKTPCCRLKEECTFGKTKSTSRHTCAKSPTSAPGTTDINKAAIIGATVGCVLVFILIISAVLYCYRHHHPVPDDPYIDAVADMTEISNYIQYERGMSGANDQFPYKCKPEINNIYSESNSF